MAENTTSSRSSLWSRLQWWLNPRLWIRSLLLLNDSSHSIALGSAIGLFIAFTPTVGIQMLIVAMVALLTRPWFHFNRIAALLMVYVSNPFTVLPIYWFSYKIGTYWFPSNVTRDQFAALLQYQGFQQWWASLSGLFVDVGTPLIVGSLIVSTVVSLPAYPVLLWTINKLRPGFHPEQQAIESPGVATRPTAVLVDSHKETTAVNPPSTNENVA